jgi:hypothetical protein
VTSTTPPTCSWCGAPGAREAARLAWRARVAEAARAWQPWAAFGHPLIGGRFSWLQFERSKAESNRRGMFSPPLSVLPEALELDAALAAPKPWTRGGQRAQPVRHPRRMRGCSPLGCCWCRRCQRWYAAQADAFGVMPPWDYEEEEIND